MVRRCVMAARGTDKRTRPKSRTRHRPSRQTSESDGRGKGFRVQPRMSASSGRFLEGPARVGLAVWRCRIVTGLHIQSILLQCLWFRVLFSCPRMSLCLFVGGGSECGVGGVRKLSGLREDAVNRSIMSSSSSSRPGQLRSRADRHLIPGWARHPTFDLTANRAVKVTLETGAAERRCTCGRARRGSQHRHTNFWLHGNVALPIDSIEQSRSGGSIERSRGRAVAVQLSDRD
ncbi:hypothetical protein QBC39DRAFT_436892 [Podospora conica]|nr:hypothetical protein QBC39DRAFT_436892 [Schizothecium conicum]